MNLKHKNAGNILGIDMGVKDLISNDSSEFAATSQQELQEHKVMEMLVSITGTQEITSRINKTINMNKGEYVA